MQLSSARMIQEKKPEAKISWHCPFSGRISRKIRVGDYRKAKFRKYKLQEDSKLRNMKNCAIFITVPVPNNLMLAYLIFTCNLCVLPQNGQEN